MSEIVRYPCLFTSQKEQIQQFILAIYGVQSLFALPKISLQNFLGKLLTVLLLCYLSLKEKYKRQKIIQTILHIFSQYPQIQTFVSAILGKKSFFIIINSLLVQLIPIYKLQQQLNLQVLVTNNPSLNSSKPSYQFSKKPRQFKEYHIFYQQPPKHSFKFRCSQPIIIILISMMKWTVFLALICTFSMQQVSLFSSNTDNTIITSPSGYYPVLQAYHTQMHPNYIGYSAQWLYKNGADSWPAGDTATLQSYFYSACQNSATLVITADDEFSVSVNGGKAFTGNTQLKIYRFTVNNLKCGTNTISVNVTHKDPGAPVAVIYAVVQDQTICFLCASPLAYFNRYTCKCQCNEKGKCPTAYPNYVWKNYPACGCACSKVLKCSAKQYFNLNSCRCECNPKSCLPGYVQSLKTCNCIKKCPIITTCTKNQTWSETECKCNCTTVKKCDTPLYWNTVTCACETAMKPAAPAP